MRQAAHTVLNFALAALFVAGGESFLASLTVLARHRPLFGVVGVASTSGKEVLDDFQEYLGEKPPVRTSSLLLVICVAGTKRGDAAASLSTGLPEGLYALVVDVVRMQR